MKLFVSWSGERSKALAFALRDWLPLVLHYVEPWLSEADIDAGTRWADAVAKQLETCNFGVICITRENLTSPWILFESGALAKSLEGSRVIPLLLDLDFREISGPLAQFQAKKVEKAGLLEIVDSINKTAPHAVPEDRYKQLFDALWPDLEKKVGAIPKATTPSKQTRTQADILEELVGAVRAMESRVRDGVEEPRSIRRRSKSHPMMLNELGHMLSEKPGDPISILVFASALREDATVAVRTRNGGVSPSLVRQIRRGESCNEAIRSGRRIRHARTLSLGRVWDRLKNAPSHSARYQSRS